MPSYFVTWEIHIEAPNARAAAQEALRIHHDKNSSATVFDVFDEAGEKTHIDLDEEEKSNITA